MSLSNFPNAIDTNENLYQVHDSLRAILAEDYNVGDTSISVIVNESIMQLFPPTGIITLTDQCASPELRAVSFFYGSRTLTTFDQLQILDGFTDADKPKLLTNVTQNVMAIHHNALKDALIAVQEFAGIKGETSLQPLVGSMEARINYVRKIALTPKAWFKSDVTTGRVPLSVNFTNQSFRLGTDGASENISYYWTVTKVSESGSTIVANFTTENFTYIFTEPANYDISLEVTNDFGTDDVMFPSMINARGEAPDVAVIDIDSGGGLEIVAESPLNGPYTTTPVIKFPTNLLIDIGIRKLTGEYPNLNPNTNKTFGGEYVDINNQPVDPITSYTWSITDDLSHSNSPDTKAIFSIGGIYDLTLRCDTFLGAYRITNYSQCLDIVENVNLWLWCDSATNGAYPVAVSVSEFGIISETFKIRSVTKTLGINNEFLVNPLTPNSPKQLYEFYRNNGFATQGDGVSSGVGGSGYLYWSTGRGYYDSISTETIQATIFNGFLETYSVGASPFPITRPWNWLSFNSPDAIYFFLGYNPSGVTPGNSPTNQTKTRVSLIGETPNPSSTVFPPSNYQNGANELLLNPIANCEPQTDMSVYRTAWFNNAGYILRNDTAYIQNPTDLCPNYFRIKSFYKTVGNISDPFIQITKLSDMIGSAKVEGQLLSLSQGLYFFNNSGSVTAYNATSNTWSIGGPGANSVNFRSLQDTSVLGYDDSSQTFLAASDNSNLAFLSFDYSSNVFIKFNEIDTTFSSTTQRTSGKQWQMCIF